MVDRELLVRKVHETFPATEVADVLAILEEQPEMMVQLAVVKNAAGSMDRLLAWLYEARKDWRDMLVAAGYPRQAAYGPGQAPAEIVAADLAAYQAWLREGSRRGPMCGATGSLRGRRISFELPG